MDENKKDNGGMSNKTLVFVGALAVLIVGGGVSVYWKVRERAEKADSASQVNPMVTVSEPEEQVENSQTSEPFEQNQNQDEGVRVFNVTGEDFSFNPGVINVKQGEMVRLNFSSIQGTHDWMLDEYGVGTKVLGPGESETIEFVAHTPGSFAFYCSVGQHRQMGMVGILNVEEVADNE